MEDAEAMEDVEESPAFLAAADGAEHSQKSRSRD
jgi:hypothetical protein